MEFLLLLFLILLNGAFAMSEIALIAARKARLQKMVADGEAGAATALKLAESPTDFLSTIQIGITSIGILNGIVGESVFARPLGEWLESLGMTGRWADPLATALVVVIVTYLTIVIGELVPKRLGQIGAEAIARRVARPMLWLATVSRPFVQLLSASTHLVLRIFGMRAAKSCVWTQHCRSRRTWPVSNKRPTPGIRWCAAACMTSLAWSMHASCCCTRCAATNPT